MINETIVPTILTFSNASAPIPIQILAQSNWTQYTISLIFSAFFVIYFFSDKFRISINNIILKTMLHKFSKMTGRPTLLINHKEVGLLSADMITTQMIPKINRVLESFNDKPFNLILNTPGGEVFATMLLSTILRKYPQKVHCYIPNYAMSGGSLLALSCDTIYMNPHSCIGTIDPQIGGFFSHAPTAGWREVLKIKKAKADDKSIVYRRVGQQVQQSIQSHIESILKNRCNNPKSFAQFLTNGDVEHIYQITPERLKDEGFNIMEIGGKESKLLNKVISLKGTTSIMGV
jgi:ATP-dependent protease ClpP protease subunit